MNKGSLPEDGVMWVLVRRYEECWNRVEPSSTELLYLKTQNFRITEYM